MGEYYFIPGTDRKREKNRGKREKEPRVFSLQFIEYIDAMNWRFFHERIKTEFEYLFFFC